jgi:hypothetical protein
MNCNSTLGAETKKTSAKYGGIQRDFAIYTFHQWDSITYNIPNCINKFCFPILLPYFDRCSVSRTHPPEYFTLATLILRTVTILRALRLQPTWCQGSPGEKRAGEREGRRLRPTSPYKC